MSTTIIHALQWENSKLLTHVTATLDKIYEIHMIEMSRNSDVNVGIQVGQNLLTSSDECACEAIIVGVGPSMPPLRKSATLIFLSYHQVTRCIY